MLTYLTSAIVKVALTALELLAVLRFAQPIFLDAFPLHFSLLFVLSFGSRSIQFLIGLSLVTPKSAGYRAPAELAAHCYCYHTHSITSRRILSS